MYQTVNEILKIIIGWETRLYDCYRDAGWRLKDERSRKIVGILREDLQRHLEGLCDIDTSRQSNLEFLKNVPDFCSPDVLPPFVLDAQDPPEEVFRKALSYEENFVKIYRRLYELSNFHQSKDLFDMLLQFKLGQIKHIKALMDGYDMAL